MIAETQLELIKANITYQRLAIRMANDCETVIDAHLIIRKLKREQRHITARVREFQKSIIQLRLAL